MIIIYLITGQILQVVRTANGAQYIIQPQQPVVLQQQVIPQMQPGGVQAPVIQQVKKKNNTPESRNLIVIIKQVCIFAGKLKWSTKTEIIC